MVTGDEPRHRGLSLAQRSAVLQGNRRKPTRSLRNVTPSLKHIHTIYTMPAKTKTRPKLHYTTSSKQRQSTRSTTCREFSTPPVCSWQVVGLELLALNLRLFSSTGWLGRNTATEAARGQYRTPPTQPTVNVQQGCCLHAAGLLPISSGILRVASIGGRSTCTSGSFIGSILQGLQQGRLRRHNMLAYTREVARRKDAPPSFRLVHKPS